MAAVIFGSALVAPNIASAATAYTSGNLNMRTGPGTHYGRVLVIPAGAPVALSRCLRGRSWCKVSFAGYRGWVSGRYLVGARRNVYRGPVYDAPSIGFSWWL